MNNYEFIYKKYDALNRIIETGEYEITNGQSSQFNKTNAENSSFPSANNLVWKKFYYDTPSTASMAAGQRNLIGRLSYAQSFRFGNPGAIYYYSYDNMGRIEWMVESGITSSSKKIFYTYDLQGNVTEVEYDDGDNYSLYQFYTDYKYDPLGRMTNVSTNNNYEGGYNIANYQYYASGKVKQLETAVDDAPTFINYQYNERDWLTSLSSNKFWEHVGYNLISEVGSLYNSYPQFNGNISWDTYYMSTPLFQDPYSRNSGNRLGYAYSYDKSNRLISAYFGFEDSNNIWNKTDSTFTISSINYDSVGNIKILKRYGSGTNLMDLLNYFYRPGTDLDTLITNSAGSGSAYTYDSNGNVVSDGRNNIAFTIYDLDNLPRTQYKTDGTVIYYDYDVNDNRVSKQYGSVYSYYVRGKDGETLAVIPGNTSSREIYNILGEGGDNIAQQIWDYSGGELTHFYYLKDHLGNVKMILNQVGGVDSYNDYYPFGMQMPGRNGVASADARYKFTGKERDGETNLDDFGARYYDSWRGQWGQVDPLLEDNPDLSPYVYCSDNPINIIDEDGMQGHWATDPSNPNQLVWLEDPVYSSPNQVYSMKVYDDDFFAGFTTIIKNGLNWAENKLDVHPPSWVNDLLASPPVPAGPEFEAGSEAEKLLEGGESAAEGTINANRLNHIFGKTEHNLESLVEKYGSQENAFNAVQKAANKALKEGQLTPSSEGILPSGNSGNIINVDGIKVRLIGGRVEGDQLIISSFSRKGF